MEPVLEETLQKDVDVVSAAEVGGGSWKVGFETVVAPEENTGAVLNEVTSVLGELSDAESPVFKKMYAKLEEEIVTQNVPIVLPAPADMASSTTVAVVIVEVIA